MGGSVVSKFVVLETEQSEHLSSIPFADRVPRRDELLAQMRRKGKDVYHGIYGRLSADFDWIDLAKIYRDGRDWKNLPNPADGVRKIFTEQVKGPFTAVRLGRKWGDILAPNDHLTLHIIPDQDKPEEVIVIGWAWVESVTKKYVNLLMPEELTLHVGGKTIHDVCEELTAVHGKPITDVAVRPDVVTVIRMYPEAFFPFVPKIRKPAATGGFGVF